MKFLKFIYFLSFFSFSQEFYIDCSNRVVQGSYFNLSFVLKYEDDVKIENFQPPIISDFSGNTNKPQMSNSSQSSTTIINGKRTTKKFYTQRFSYTLKANNAGKYYINPASIVVDGKILKTKKKQITVLEDLAYIESDNVEKKPIYFKVYSDEIDNEVYVGEPIKLTYKISYPANFIPVDYEWPDLVNYSNVWKEEIEINGQPIREIIDGEAYNSVEIRSVILLYQKDGIYNINKQNFNISFAVECSRYDRRLNKCQFIQGYGWAKDVVIKDIETNKLSIKVKSLPEDKPSSFIGAIGQYSFKINELPDSIDYNDVLSVNLDLNGYGNLNYFDLPKLNFGNDSTVDVYDPEINDNWSIYDSRTIKGYKKHNYLILANNKNPGYIYFPEYEISYFDPKKEEYIIKKQESKKIKVIGEFNDKKINKSINQTNNNKIFNSLNNYLLLIVIFIIIALIFFLIYSYRFKKLTKKNKQSKSARDAKSQIKKAYKLAQKNNPDLFKNLLLQSLFLYFSKKFNIKQSNFTKDKLEKELKKNKLSNDIIINSLNIINKLEMFNYSGRNELKITQSIFKDSIDVIDQIEKLKK